MSVTNSDDELSDIFKKFTLEGESGVNNILKCGIIPPIFAQLECPFLWKYHCDTDARGIVDKVEEKLLDMQDEDDVIVQWKTFVFNLILCYEYGRNGDIQIAVEKQLICDTILDECVNQCNAAVMGCGLRHISLACKCFLMYASNTYDETQKIFDTIVPVKVMKTREKASIMCMKGAYCAELGYQGIKDSVTLIEKAVTMDKECPEWAYLLGRSLGRLRRIENRTAIPDKRELRTLERAVELSNNAVFMVLLAQAYRETARSVFIGRRSELNKFKPDCDSLNQKSLELYRKALEEGKDNVHNLVRCAFGFMKLPPPWKNLHDARMYILKAVNIAPRNPMANHVAGTYFSIVGDYEQSVLYYSKAAAMGVFGAEMDLISMKKRRNSSYVPVADFERLLDVYKEKPRQETALCFLGAHYYDVEKDFKKALKYWIRVINTDIKSDKLRVHHDTAAGKCRSFNINKIVITEIMKLLDSGNVSEEERETYDEIIDKYIKNHPGLVYTVTDIDTSKYKNKKFVHKSWMNRDSILSKSSERNWRTVNKSKSTSTFQKSVGCSSSESNSLKSHVKSFGLPRSNNSSDSRLETSTSRSCAQRKPSGGLCLGNASPHDAQKSNYSRDSVGSRGNQRGAHFRGLDRHSSENHPHSTGAIRKNVGNNAK